MKTFKEINAEVLERFPGHTFTVERVGYHVRFFDNETGALTCQYSTRDGSMIIYE